MTQSAEITEKQKNSISPLGRGLDKISPTWPCCIHTVHVHVRARTCDSTSDLGSLCVTSLPLGNVQFDDAFSRRTIASTNGLLMSAMSGHLGTGSQSQSHKVYAVAHVHVTNTFHHTVSDHTITLSPEILTHTCTHTHTHTHKRTHTA